MKCRTYSPAQLNYMAATAALKAIGGDVTEDAYCDALQVKLEAERALFAWCRQVIASDPKTAQQFAANVKDIDRLFTVGPKFPAIRERLISACLKLEVPNVG